MSPNLYQVSTNFVLSGQHFLWIGGSIMFNIVLMFLENIYISYFYGSNLHGISSTAPLLYTISLLWSIRRYRASFTWCFNLLLYICSSLEATVVRYPHMMWQLVIYDLDMHTIFLVATAAIVFFKKITVPCYLIYSTPSVPY